MPSWVYVLTDGQGFYYVGVTNRLFIRFKEHYFGKGSLATSNFDYGFLAALYKVDEENRYFYENLITQQLMKLSDNPWKIRGGSWTNHGLTKTNLKQPKSLKEIQMPVICNCGMPVVEFQNKKGNIFYKCSLKYYDWINHYEEGDLGVDSTGGCDFFKSETEVVCEPEPNCCFNCKDYCGKRTQCVSCTSKFFQSQSIKPDKYFSNIKIVDDEDDEDNDEDD